MTRLSELEREMIHLQALIEALDVVTDLAAVAGDGVEVALDVKRARNSVPAVVEALHVKSEAILQAIGQLALDEREAAATAEK